MKKFNYTNYFLKHLSIYTVANFFEKIAVFALLPIYTHYLSQTEFGQLALGLAFVTIILQVCELGYTQGFFRFYDTYKKEDKSKYYSNYFFTYILWTLLIITILYLFNKQFAGLIFNNTNYKNIINLILLYIFFHSTFFALSARYRITGKSNYYSISNFGLTLLRIGLTALFLIYYNYKIKGVFYGFIISNLILVVILLILNFKHIKFYLNFKFSKQNIKFGFPLLLTGIFFLILELSDKFIIKYYFQEYNLVGIYEINYKLSSIMLFIIAPFNILCPHLLFSFDKETLKKSINKIFGIYSSLLIILSFTIILFSEILVKIFADKNYFITDKLIIILTFGYIFFGIYYFTNLSFFIKNKTKNIFIISLTVALFNLILNFVLIPYYKLYGAAISTMLSYILMAIVSYIISNKNSEIKISIYDFIKSILINFILFFVIYYFINQIDITNIINAILKFIIILFFCILNFILIKKKILWN